MKSTTTKEDFIKKLTTMSREEINEFIKQNGKPRKPVRLFSKIIHNEENRPD